MYNKIKEIIITATLFIGACILSFFAIYYGVVYIAFSLILAGGAIYILVGAYKERKKITQGVYKGVEKRDKKSEVSISIIIGWGILILAIILFII